jgi:hypothetical protein
MVNPWGEETDIYYDYPAGYFTSAAAMVAPKPMPKPMPMPMPALLGGLDPTRLLKTGALALALYFAFPKGDKSKLVKIGLISAAVYFIY